MRKNAGRNKPKKSKKCFYKIFLKLMCKKFYGYKNTLLKIFSLYFAFFAVLKIFFESNNLIRHVAKKLPMENKIHIIEFIGLFLLN